MRKSVPIVLLTAMLAVPAGGAMPSREASPDVRLRAVELAAEDPMPGGTFVVIENRGAKRVSVGCWRVRTRRAELAIRPPAAVPAGGALRLLFDRGEVGNPDRIRLLTAAGRLADATPVLHDTQGDDRLFGRGADGWTLGRPTLPARTVDGKLVKPRLAGC